MSKAKYFARNSKQNYEHDEGCGCCYSSAKVVIEKNLVIRHDHDSYRGEYRNGSTVIGRIKSSQWGGA